MSRLYQIMKNESVDICKDSDNRKLKQLTKDEKWAVKLQMLEWGGKKGFHRYPKMVCESQRLRQDSPASS